MSAPNRLRAALYARYSTDGQSDASVEDQFRVCVRISEREGFVVSAHFEDRGISGGTSRRPGYQAMLEAARRHEFDVILAEDLKRLWREQAEQWRCIKELLDLGICIITASGIDSRQSNFEVIASVIGAAAELDRKEASYRTRRGLEGVAVAGRHAGGRAYGYIPVRESSTGQIEINESEASVVRRIFQMYADGKSPRNIAALLNSEGVLSPGASWAWKISGPTGRRRSKWVASAIHGDVKRGSGILNNERYIGHIIWGRVRYRRGAADSRKRSVHVADPSQWIERQDERFRIVPQELWDRVKRRQKSMAASWSAVRRRGRPPATLLAGILVCESCGSRFVAINEHYYACASNRNGGMAACSNTARVSRNRTEKAILAEIEAEILSDEAVRHAQKAMQDELRRVHKVEYCVVLPEAKLHRLEAQAKELRALQKAGTLSPAVARTALDAVERQRAKILSASVRRDHKPSADVIRVIPHGVELYRTAVRNLSATLVDAADRMRARTLITDLLNGELKVRREGSIHKRDRAIETQG
jgi:DNA invertase Pin-like site-specific DNA recombinase